MSLKPTVHVAEGMKFGSWTALSFLGIVNRKSRWMCRCECGKERPMVASSLPKATHEHSIDRIDNDGPYSPENCRWATAEQQMRNRTDSAFVELNGVRLTMIEWSERLGVSQALLTWRIKAWGTERALTTVGTRRQRKVATEPGLEVEIEIEELASGPTLRVAVEPAGSVGVARERSSRAGQGARRRNQT